MVKRKFSTLEPNSYQKDHQMIIKGQYMKTHKLFILPIGNEKIHRNIVSPKSTSAKISSRVV